jgi:hypothetical protein
LLPRWHPAYRRREPDSGVNVERGKLRPRHGKGEGECLTRSERETPKWPKPQGAEYRCEARQ